jgi:hypothetical protein
MTRCQHTDARGHRCRMPCATNDLTLCGTHLEAHQRHLRSVSPAQAHELLNGVTGLQTTASVHHMLGNLATLLAGQRIDPRTGMVLAYLAQLLLQTINLANRERST